MIHITLRSTCGCSLIPLFAVAFALELGRPASAGDAASKSMSLAYVLTDPSAPYAEALAQCDKLTVEKYREHGVKVIEKPHAELAKWLEGEGKEWSKAHPNFQRLAYARSLKVDAIGGLESTDIGLEAGAPPKTIFLGWGMSLAGCTGGGQFDIDGGAKVRAVPLFTSGSSLFPIGDSANSWQIPSRVDAIPCSAADSTRMAIMPSGKGRPFLGVRLNGTSVSEVVPDSPALAAGLQPGDALTKVGGVEITDQNALRSAMEGKKPGDEIEIVFTRDGANQTRKVTLADYHDVVEVKQAREGKPLPALTAKDIDGKTVSLADLKGKVVLIDYWATWCGPCKDEMPYLQLLAEQNQGKDFVWVSVSADEDEQAWKDFVRNNKLAGIQLRSMEWASAMHINAFPTVILVDRAGVMQCELRGERIAQAVTAMLASKN